MVFLYSKNQFVWLQCPIRLIFPNPCFALLVAWSLTAKGTPRTGQIQLPWQAGKVNDAGPLPRSWSHTGQSYRGKPAGSTVSESVQGWGESVGARSFNFPFRNISRFHDVYYAKEKKSTKWSRRNAFSGRAGHRLLRDEKMIKCPFRTGNNPAGSASNARESLLRKKVH